VNTQKPPLTKPKLLTRANELLPSYRAALAMIPPEAGFGGIWESEMLLFCAAVESVGPKQILESGRARGKSTMILARCFPDLPIISVEFDRESDNAAAAEQKLGPFRNIELVYGDSRDILPQRLQFGDAVIIDGPKDFRALELAIDLLRTEKPSVVFVHDFPSGSLWRKFLERHWPSAFFGDDPAFEPFRALDQERDPRPPSHRRGYGIFAILPGQLPASASSLRFRLLLTRLFGRVF
jgi:hypothetical protein